MKVSWTARNEKMREAGASLAWRRVMSGLRESELAARGCLSDRVGLSGDGNWHEGVGEMECERCKT